MNILKFYDWENSELQVIKIEMKFFCEYISYKVIQGLVKIYDSKGFLSDYKSSIFVAHSILFAREEADCWIYWILLYVRARVNMTKSSSLHGLNNFHNWTHSQSSTLKVVL